MWPKQFKIIKNKANKKFQEFGIKYSMGQLASFLGTTKGKVRNWEAGQHPSAHDLQKISEKLNLDPEWLLMGTGTPEKDSEKTIDSSSMVYIPLVKAKLSAGDGSFKTEDHVINRYAFKKSFISEISTGVKNLVLLRVMGNSMSPKIENNDFVMIDLGKKDIFSNKIYAIRIEDTINLKEIELLPKHKVRIISRNRKEYPSYILDIKDLFVIGQAVWSCKHLEIIP